MTFQTSQRLLVSFTVIPESHILTSTLVQGHAGKLVVGTMGETKVPVVLLVGRAQ
jgi:purine-nucleoside phosphorylase